MALLWIALGFAAFGLMVGVTAGLSSAQLTTTLLGLLFALIGGSIGVLLGKLSHEDRKFAGVAMTTFSICAIAGLFLGIYVRINDLLTKDRHTATASVTQGEVAHGVDYLKSNSVDLTAYLQHSVGAEQMTLETACQRLESERNAKARP